MIPYAKPTTSIGKIAKIGERYSKINKTNTSSTVATNNFTSA